MADVVAEAAGDEPGGEAQGRPVPGGIAEWQGQKVRVHLTGAGRVRSVEGTLAHLGGDGVVINEDDTDWWVPREHVQALSRSHEQEEQ